jgi:hypothetical protein
LIVNACHHSAKLVAGSVTFRHRMAFFAVKISNPGRIFALNVTGMKHEAPFTSANFGALTLAQISPNTSALPSACAGKVQHYAKTMRKE